MGCTYFDRRKRFFVDLLERSTNKLAWVVSRKADPTIIESRSEEMSFVRDVVNFLNTEQYFTAQAPEQRMKPLEIEEVLFITTCPDSICWLEGEKDGETLFEGWVEPWKTKSEGVLSMYAPGEADPEQLPVEAYGVWWRCWPSKPSSDDIAAAPWEAENDGE